MVQVTKMKRVPVTSDKYYFKGTLLKPVKTTYRIIEDKDGVKMFLEKDKPNE